MSNNMDRMKRKNNKVISKLRGASAQSTTDMTNPTVAGVDLGDSSSLAAVLSPSGDTIDRITFKMTS